MVVQEEIERPIDFLTSHLHGKPYHMTHSGYETLIDFIGKSRVFYVRDFQRITKLSYPLRLFRIIPKSYSSLHAELVALKSQGSILHHLYGEDTLWLSLIDQFADRRPVIATFHRPPNVLNSTMPFFWKRAIRKLAGIVVLSPGQLAFLRSVCRPAKTRFSLIPHGVDTDYFTPSKKDRSKDLVISVGNYLRDYEILVKAMKNVSIKAPRLQLILVSKRQTVPTQNVIPRVAISDEELLRYYREASFMILPFADLVASNVMLEAMACGMPVVCPRFESARYYMGENVPTTYEPRNPNDLADKIISLYERDDERRHIGSQMRERAQFFSWPRISSLLRSFYDLILEC